jgi:NAD(P)H dehydrogenase (quinone)
MLDGVTGLIGVTGVTGRVGGRVARRLAELGVPQRMLARDPQRAPRLPGAELAIASYGDTEQARAALTGVHTLLMVSASEAADRLEQHFGFVAAAAAVGVEHVVYTSFDGAGPACTFTLGRDHWATEERLRATGMATTMLRDNFYLDLLPLFAGEDGVLRGPAGQGRVAAVATRDVADVALAVLRDPAAHAGAAYRLTGPQSLTLDEIAAITSRVTGRPMSYHAETLDEAYASRSVYGAPDWQVQAWVSTYTAIASGELAEVTDDVPRLTGRPATSLEQLLVGTDAR